MNIPTSTRNRKQNPRSGVLWPLTNTHTMKSLLFGIFFVIAAPLFGQIQASNPALLAQSSSDMTAFMISRKDNLETPLTEEAIKQAVAATAKKFQDKHPERFVTTPEEAKLLSNGKSIVSNEKLTEAIQARRNYKTILPFPPLLQFYEDLQSSIGLNPYQQLLALRLAEDALTKAKQRDEIQSKIKKKNQ